MPEHVSTRDRLKELNTKAYYLLVALSFLYYRRSDAVATSLKVAVTLTAMVAVAPVQDWVKSDGLLEFIRRFKVACLIVALAFTLYWIWAVS